ncbi:hypothetical protein YC2023_107119 [Brassica napus]
MFLSTSCVRVAMVLGSSPCLRAFLSHQIVCITACRVYLRRKVLIGVSQGFEIILIRLLQSVVNMSCIRPPARFLQTFSEYRHPKKRCAHDSDSSLHRTHSVFIELGHILYL